MKNYQPIIHYKSLNLGEELITILGEKTGEPIDRYQYLLDAARYIITDRLKEQSRVHYNC